MQTEMKTFIYFSQGEWRTFQAEELPDKNYNRGCNVCEGFGKTDIETVCKCWLDYQSEIAELKAKSLPVGNPKMFTNTQGYWLDVNVGNGKPKEDEFYRWPGTVEVKKVQHCDEYHQHTKKSCYVSEAILKLPA